jgi:hypothetical protein
VHLDPSRVIKKGRVEVAPGKGAVRCPKCGYRQEEHGSCFQCGLDLTRFGESDAWERSPPGKEAQAIALKERWDAICERGLESAQETEAFINLASNDQLLDLAARWLRFYAQDHFGTPAGERASRALARLVERMHVEFVSSHGPGSRDAYVQRTKAVQGVLYVVAALMCVGVIVLAMVIFKPF